MKTSHLLTLLIVFILYLLVEPYGYGNLFLALIGLFGLFGIYMLNLKDQRAIDGSGENFNEMSLEDLIKRAGSPKQQTRPGYDDVSIGIIPIHRGDKISVLISQSKMQTPTGKNPWGFAKGHVDAGENEKEGAIRENQEELGITVDATALTEEITMEDNMMIDETKLRKHLIKMIEKGEEPHVNRVGLMKRLIVFYVANMEDKIKPKPDIGEILDAKWVTLDEAEKMIRESDSNQLQVLESLKEKLEEST